MQKLTLALTLAAAAAAIALSPVQAAGNVARGESKASMCIGCHGIVGYQASFPEVHRVPMISGQTAQYIAAALEAYAKGERKHPTMRGLAGSLSSDDIADLAAFYAQHGGPSTAPAAAQPSGAVADLLKRNADACMSCHGDNFSTPVAGKGAVPRLAGQHADYLYVALKSYQSSHPLHGRGNGLMQGQVKGYTHAELKSMAKYLASLPGQLKTEPQARFRFQSAKAP